MRGAHDLVEARRLALSVLDDARGRVPRTRPRRSTRFAELRAPLPDVLSKDEAKAVIRELKAVGGNLQGAARRAHRRRARAGAVGRAARAAARRGAAPRTTLIGVRLYDTFIAVARRAAAAARPRPDVLLRPDGLRARPHRQRAAVHRRHVAARRGCARAATTRSSSTTSRTSTTRSTTRRRARAPSSPRARPSGTSRTPATSGSACRTTCRRRPSRCPQIVAFIEELIAPRQRVRERRRRLLQRRQLPRVRAALAARSPTRSSRARSRAR